MIVYIDNDTLKKIMVIAPLLPQKFKTLFHIQSISHMYMYID